MNRRAIFVRVLISLWPSRVSARSVFEFVRRFEAAESYLNHITAGECRKAYNLLDGEITFGEFVARVDAWKKSLADRLKEHGIVLLSETVERITPMTFEGQRVIVAVRSHVVGKRHGEIAEDDVLYDISLRFDDDGKINMIQIIGEGWVR